MRSWALILCAAMTLGCAASQADPGASDPADMAEALAGRTAGAAVRCIDLGSSSGPRIVGENLLYRDGRRLWVSQPVNGCPSLRGDPIIVVQAHGSQLCENDRFQTIQRGDSAIPGPSCRFGAFVPYTKTGG